MRKFSFKPAIILSLIIIFAIFAISLLQSAGPVNPSLGSGAEYPFQLYTNKQYAFQFSYPQTYTIKEKKLNEGVSLTLHSPENTLYFVASVDSADFSQFRVDRGTDVQFGKTTWKYDPPSEFCDGPGCGMLDSQYGVKHGNVYYYVSTIDEEAVKEDLNVILNSFRILD